MALKIPDAVDVRVTEDNLSVELSDGRTISVPLGWFPRLEYATPSERANWRLIGNGRGIHWEDIDEDISVEGLLAGQAIRGESIVIQAVATRQTIKGKKCIVARVFPPPRLARSHIHLWVDSSSKCTT
jgi:hypothetical protein